MSEEEQKHDYLEVDDILPHQQYVCLSFLSPEALIEKRDRAGHNGKNIKCPHCEKVDRINNLRWKTKTCKFCLVESTKYEWLIDQLDTWRTPR